LGDLVTEDTPTVYTLELNEDDCEHWSRLIRHEINYYQVVKARTEKQITSCTDEVEHDPRIMSETILERHIESLAEEEKGLAKCIALNEKLMSCGCKRATNWEGKIPGDE